MTERPVAGLTEEERRAILEVDLGDCEEGVEALLASARRKADEECLLVEECLSTDEIRFRG